MTCWWRVAYENICNNPRVSVSITPALPCSFFLLLLFSRVLCLPFLFEYHVGYFNFILFYPGNMSGITGVWCYFIVSLVFCCLHKRWNWSWRLEVSFILSRVHFFFLLVHRWWVFIYFFQFWLWSGSFKLFSDLRSTFSSFQ